MNFDLELCEAASDVTMGWLRLVTGPHCYGPPRRKKFSLNLSGPRPEKVTGARTVALSLWQAAFSLTFTNIMFFIHDRGGLPLLFPPSAVPVTQ